MLGETKLFAGTSNRNLAERIAEKLNMKLEDTEITRFSDGEIRVELKNNVRCSRAIIVQSTCAPTNDTIMEMILLADALRRSSVTEIVAVVPYYGYARADRRPGYARVPISARIVADLIETVGVDHVITVDLHATQIQGFFHIPIDNISATQLFVADIYKNWSAENPIIVSPDVGGVARARALAKNLDDMDLAIVDKRRPKANVSEVMNIIGDVRDKTCIIVDDMVDTAGTLCKAADALVNVAGARRVVAYATHGVLSGPAASNINLSAIERLTITDTIPLPQNFICAKVCQLSIADILAETITRVQNGQSISEILE